MVAVILSYANKGDLPWEVGRLGGHALHPGISSDGSTILEAGDHTYNRSVGPWTHEQRGKA